MLTTRFAADYHELGFNAVITTFSKLDWPQTVMPFGKFENSSLIDDSIMNGRVSMLAPIFSISAVRQY